MTVDMELLAQIRAMINKARRSLRAARRHLDDHDFDFDVSVDKTDAGQDVAEAVARVDAVEGCLRTSGFFSPA